MLSTRSYNFYNDGEFRRIPEVQWSLGVKNDICLEGASKQNGFFSKIF